MRERDEKPVRLHPYGEWDTDVQFLIKIGTKRHPVSIDGAKRLFERLGRALGRLQ